MSETNWTQLRETIGFLLSGNERTVLEKLDAHVAGLQRELEQSTRSYQDLGATSVAEIERLNEELEQAKQREKELVEAWTRLNLHIYAQNLEGESDFERDAIAFHKLISREGGQ